MTRKVNANANGARWTLAGFALVFAGIVGADAIALARAGELANPALAIAGVAIPVVSAGILLTLNRLAVIAQR